MNAPSTPAPRVRFLPLALDRLPSTADHADPDSPAWMGFDQLYAHLAGHPSPIAFPVAVRRPASDGGWEVLDCDAIVEGGRVVLSIALPG